MNAVLVWFNLASFIKQKKDKLKDSMTEFLTQDWCNALHKHDEIWANHFQFNNGHDDADKDMCRAWKLSVTEIVGSPF
jgi:hypothetical protein